MPQRYHGDRICFHTNQSSATAQDSGELSRMARMYRVMRRTPDISLLYHLSLITWTLMHWWAETVDDQTSVTVPRFVVTRSSHSAWIKIPSTSESYLAYCTTVQLKHSTVHSGMCFGGVATCTAACECRTFIHKLRTEGYSMPAVGRKTIKWPCAADKVIQTLPNLLERSRLLPFVFYHPSSRPRCVLCSSRRFYCITRDGRLVNQPL